MPDTNKSRKGNMRMPKTMTVCPLKGKCRENNWKAREKVLRIKRREQPRIECYFNAKPWIRDNMFNILLSAIPGIDNNKLKSKITEAIKSIQRCNALHSLDKEPISVNERCYEVCRMLMKVHYPEGLAMDLLYAWKEYEKSLWKVTPYYRDHFLHALYDFSIGKHFLAEFNEDICHNWRVLGRTHLPDEVLIERSERTWLLAALFHDIGYPAEKLCEFSRFARNKFFDKVPGMTLSDIKLVKSDSIKDDINELLTMMAYVLMDDEYSFTFRTYKRFVDGKTYPNKLIFDSIRALFADQIEKLDHGVVGALLVMLTLKIDIHELTLSDKTNNYDALIVERNEVLEDVVVAALAIAIHNVRASAYPGLTIDYRTHPVAFLLSLCDELHEWERMVRDKTLYKGEDDIIIDVEAPRIIHMVDIMGNKRSKAIKLEYWKCITKVARKFEIDDGAKSKGEGDMVDGTNKVVERI